MLEGQRVTVQGITQNASAFMTISKDPKEQHLCKLSASDNALQYKESTSTSFDFKNGFLMYHVEVRKVRANITSSFFPESSRELGECLKPFPR